MEKEKRNDELAKYGLFVIQNMNLVLVLTDNENKLFNAIRHNCNNNNPLSYSLLEVTQRMIKKNTISNSKQNLIKLGFIQQNAVTNKGTYYSVLYKNITPLITKLGNELNPIKRLEIADGYRIEKGLEPINSKVIERYKGSEFDTTIKEIAGVEDSNNKLEYYESEDAQYLNSQLLALGNNEITQIVYNRRVNAKRENNNKLIQINNKWMQIV